MILLVDIGNSRIKWTSRNARGSGRLQTADYNKASVDDCLNREWRTLMKPDQIHVANVAGKAVADTISRWSRTRWGVRPRFAQVSRAFGPVKNAYAQPGTLGVDRWLALIAAWRKYGTAACIVDCGTAVTIDGLNGKGRHLGGLILPGVTLMRQALYQNARGIPARGKTPAARGLAQDTHQAVMTGCAMAIAALIDRSVTLLMKNTPGKLTCIITGGGAAEIRPLLATRFIHDPLLVLDGLAIMFEAKA